VRRNTPPASRHARPPAALQVRPHGCTHPSHCAVCWYSLYGSLHCHCHSDTGPAHSYIAAASLHASLHLSTTPAYLCLPLVAAKRAVCSNCVRSGVAPVDGYFHLLLQMRRGLLLLCAQAPRACCTTTSCCHQQSACLAATGPTVAYAAAAFHPTQVRIQCAQPWRQPLSRRTLCLHATGGWHTLGSAPVASAAALEGLPGLIKAGPCHGASNTALHPCLWPPLAATVPWLPG
jgi:hypothetical protein